MDIVVFDRDELQCALRTLRGIVTVPTASQDRFLEKLARLHGVQQNARELIAAPAWFTAAIILDPHRRKRLVQLAILYAMVDGRVSREDAVRVDTLAHALEVEEPGVRVLNALAASGRMFPRAAMVRRTLGRLLGDAWRSERWQGVQRIVHALLGRGDDPIMARRYARLAFYPKGSLGRSLWLHCRRRNFALPGNAGAIPENVLFHDIGHVLSDYDTDPAGEIQQAAFQAGFIRRDGFAFLLFGVLQFHLGVKITPVAAPEVGYFDVEKVLTALARGAACRADLSDGWDFWSHAERPLEQLRIELGIPALKPAPQRSAAHA